MTTKRPRNEAAPPRRAAARDPRAPRSDWRFRQAGELRILEAPALARLRWVVHGFSTRTGGGSELHKDEHRGKVEHVLNLGFADWDSGQHVRENRRKFSEALAAGKMRMVTLRQTHSDLAHLVDRSNFAPGHAGPLGDALFTHEPGVLLAVQVADCIPILLADTGQRAVAAIHSGWRGTLERIAEKTLGRMRMEFGTRPEDVMAAIGPGIGACCYEVGEEVAEKFAAQFPQARDWFDGPFEATAAGESPQGLSWLKRTPPGHAPRPARLRLDLIAANRDLLTAAGVRPAAILVSGFCTACRTDLFFSYRRERNTGRQMAAIGIL
jgi:polyphenol oxidase